MSTKLEDYDVLNIIGSGSFGTCYKVCNKHTKEVFVWKAIDYGKMTEEKKQLLVSEVNLLSQLNHAHIVKYYTRILHKETTTLYIIMEWCQGGDLYSIVKEAKKYKKYLEEWFVWKVLYQTGKALQALHNHLYDKTILHRDIKPANVFLDSDGNVKLGDFGLARILENDNIHAETIVGTPYYMSPEMVKGVKYNRKSDIWALGCLIYELCSLTPPFQGTDMKQLAVNIKLGRYNRIPAHYSDNLDQIVSLMLNVDYEIRPPIEIILHHPIVIANVTMKLENINSNKDSTNFQLNKIMRTIQIAERKPNEISQNLFKEKWLARLEVLRLKEVKLREKEETLTDKERELIKREKRISINERLVKEKLERAEVYLRQCKDNKHKYSKARIVTRKTVDSDTSYSADVGNLSLEQPTMAKLNPMQIVKPNFHKIELKSNLAKNNSTISKHVHFKSENALKPIQNRMRLESYSSSTSSDHKGFYGYTVNQSCQQDLNNFLKINRSDKENNNTQLI